eukprot:7078164-Prorocentrum_lima.AAC.1
MCCNEGSGLIQNEPEVWRARPMAQSVRLFFGVRNQPLSLLHPDSRGGLYSSLPPCPNQSEGSI